MSDNTPVSADLQNKMYICNGPINYFANPAGSSIFNQWDHRWSTHSHFLGLNEYGFAHEFKTLFALRANKKVFFSLADWCQSVKGHSPFPKRPRPTKTFLLILAHYQAFVWDKDWNCRFLIYIRNVKASNFRALVICLDL